MTARLLRRSAELFFDMMAERRAASRPTDPRSTADILADIDARLAQPVPLPSLRSALSRRAALFGPVEVDA